MDADNFEAQRARGGLKNKHKKRVFNPLVYNGFCEDVRSFERGFGRRFLSTFHLSHFSFHSDHGVLV
jgi:hypothetical protein